MYVKFSYTNSSIGEDDDDADANGDEKDEDEKDEDEEVIESILKYLYNFTF
jgi:hypothetical protein